MHTITKLKNEEIKRLYNEGKMLTEICKLTSSSQPTVKKILLSVGIDYDLQKEKIYKEKLKKVTTLYNKGKSQTFIEKELNLTRKTIRELLKSADLKYKTKSEQWLIRYGNTINHNCFTILNEESLYWIGFIYTDGHISDGRENTIEISIQKGDIKHLEKLQSFFSTTREIKNVAKDCVRLRVSSKIIHNRLKELGFTNRKSWDAIPHDLLKNSKDFWRGCIDGDGGIYDNRKDKTFHITLCGTLDTIIKFIEFCETLNIKNKKVPTRNSGKCLYSISYYGQEALTIAKELYQDSAIHLDRKYKVYQNWLNKEELKKSLHL